MRGLNGKHVLITGSAHGIGFATAKRFHEEGATVILSDIDTEAGQEAADKIGPQAHFLRCDVSVARERKEMIAAIFDRFGCLDILVNNAGISSVKNFLHVTEDEFDKIIQTNLSSAFFLSQLTVKTSIDLYPSRRPLNAIVNVASIHSAIVHPDMLPYAASKGGLLQITRGLALALAERGVRVNAVGPGSINTRVLKLPLANPQSRRRILQRTPLGRVGEPEEIASVIIFLASDDASYITGQIIYVDGGRLALNYTVPVTDELA